MTREDNRLANLRKLVKEFRTIAALAEAADTNEKYLSHILNGDLLPSGRPKGVGNALARKLEHAAGKDTGWLDQDHDSGGLVVTHTDMTPDEAALLRLYRKASPARKRLMLELGRLKN